MKTIIFASLMCASFNSISFSDDKLEFRLVRESQVEGWEKIHYENTDIWISPEPELTSSSVESAEFSWQGPILTTEEVAELKKSHPEVDLGRIEERQPIVTVTFTENGRQQFEILTEKNPGKRLAIISVGKILTAPIIHATISDGVAVIQGEFTEEQAKALAAVLNTKK